MTFDPSVWAWPQWTLFILMIVRLGINAAVHGQPRKEEKHNAFIVFFNAALVLFILICGGFYG
jgi:uncharacterized membrane protein